MKNHESMKFENQNVILQCYQISNKFLFSKQTYYPSFLLNKISPQHSNNNNNKKQIQKPKTKQTKKQAQILFQGTNHVNEKI